MYYYHNQLDQQGRNSAAELNAELTDRTTHRLH